MAGLSVAFAIMFGVPLIVSLCFKSYWVAVIWGMLLIICELTVWTSIHEARKSATANAETPESPTEPA